MLGMDETRDDCGEWGSSFYFPAAVNRRAKSIAAAVLVARPEVKQLVCLGTTLGMAAEVECPLPTGAVI